MTPGGLDTPWYLNISGADAAMAADSRVAERLLFWDSLMNN